jgi:hypothetical protein
MNVAHPRKAPSLELSRQLRDDIEPTRSRCCLNGLRESSLNDVLIAPRLPQRRSKGGLLGLSRIADRACFLDRRWFWILALRT